ncbi:MAG TPA: methyltransferase domain-containing protein [Candidatus Binatia bacterium]|nr:methyltransferase domain-containing protein [Candidatus Binatia bacterium]
MASERRRVDPGAGPADPGDGPAELSSFIGTLYQQRFSPDEVRAKQALWQTLHDAFFARYVPAGAVVVDLGAGYCDLLNAVTAARRIAVDLNPDTPRFAASGVEVLPVSLEHVAAHLPAGSVDVMFASNVLEHLRSPEQLIAVLTSAHRVLRPGGRLIVMQPNVRVVGGAFWDFLDHTLPLSERGMGEALTLTGFRIVECRARFLPYSTRGRRLPSPWLVRAYLRLRPAQWLLGKQMLVVAERPR